MFFMKKLLAILIICVLSFSILGCGSNEPQKETTSTEKAQTEQKQDTSSDNSLDEKSVKDFVAEQTKKLEAVEPQRKEMEQALSETLSSYKMPLDKNVSVSDIDNLVFSVMPEVVIDNMDKEQAKQEAVQIIQKLTNANLPYKVDSYLISISDSKHNPLAVVSYTPETGKYVSLENGKRVEFQP